MTTESDWLIYRGTGEPHDGIAKLPAAPPWRQFDGKAVNPQPAATETVGSRPGADDRAEAYLPSGDVVEMVNAALYLRRPLLVTGKPGTGKSTLAYSVARELRLGPVLNWPVTSHSKLQDALYRYDAIGRLQEANLVENADEAPELGRYIRLGPVGTALVPQDRPRVLLIDELDKADVDLPNDLLNVFEEGQFDITELMRLPDDQPTTEVMTADPGGRATVHRGLVRCKAFPFVVVTSNGEREFPPAFLRRCLRLNIQPPDAGKLAAIVAGHLGDDVRTKGTRLIDQFIEAREYGDLATDQLLNAMYLVTSASRLSATTRERMVAQLFSPLDHTTR